MIKRILNTQDLVNPKNGHILFMDERKGIKKYISFDDGRFRIWSSKSSLEFKTKNRERAIEKYNTLLK
jgi:hypothetical protein